MSDLLDRIAARRDYVAGLLANHEKTESGCWLYNGKKRSGSDYGQATIYSASARPRKRTFSIHRISYAFYTGVDPRHLLVMHACDTPLCINPAHLAAGTHVDNMRDMVTKGRSTSGELNPRCKLTEPQVIEVVRLIKEGWQNTEIAKAMNVSHGMVSLIRHKKAWGRLLDSIGYSPEKHRRFTRRAA